MQNKKKSGGTLIIAISKSEESKEFKRNSDKGSLINLYKLMQRKSGKWMQEKPKKKTLSFEF